MVKPLSFKGDKKVKKRRKAGVAIESKFGHSTDSRPKSKPSSDAAEEDASWVTLNSPSELQGPAIFVFAHPPVERTGATTTATATDQPNDDSDPESAPIVAVSKPLPHLSFLAVNTLGNVSHSPLVNAINGDARTAEPDDIKQVWNTVRVAGASDSIVIKSGESGKYLGSDDLGNLEAFREAAGTEEKWELVPIEGSLSEPYPIDPTPGGVFALRNWKGSYVGISLSARSGKLVVASDCEGKRIGTGKDEIVVPPREAWCMVKMQAKYRTKPKAGQARLGEASTERISSLELDKLAGRRLDTDEIRRLRRAKRAGTFHEELLDIKVKGKHDRFA